jgi:hypothetical protein
MLLCEKELFVFKREIGSPWSFLSAAESRF